MKTYLNTLSKKMLFFLLAFLVPFIGFCLASIIGGTLLFFTICLTLMICFGILIILVFGLHLNLFYLFIGCCILCAIIAIIDIIKDRKEINEKFWKPFKDGLAYNLKLSW